MKMAKKSCIWTFPKEGTKHLSLKFKSLDIRLSIRNLLANVGTTVYLSFKRLDFFYIFSTSLTMTKSTTKKKMVSKSPNIASLVLPLLLIIFTLSSQVEHVESMGRKLGEYFYNIHT